MSRDGSSSAEHGPELEPPREGLLHPSLLLGPSPRGGSVAHGRLARPRLLDLEGQAALRVSVPSQLMQFIERSLHDLDELINLRRAELGELRRVNQHRVATAVPSAGLAVPADEGVARGAANGSAFDSVLRQLAGEQERTARLLERVRLIEAERDTLAGRLRELVVERDGLQHARLRLKDAADTKDIELDSLRSQLKRKATRVEELETQLLEYLQTNDIPLEPGETADASKDGREHWSARVSELEEQLAVVSNVGGLNQAFSAALEPQYSKVYRPYELEVVELRQEIVYHLNEKYVLLLNA